MAGLHHANDIQDLADYASPISWITYVENYFLQVYRVSFIVVNQISQVCYIDYFHQKMSYMLYHWLG